MVGLKKNQVGLLEMINAVNEMRNHSSEITTIPITRGGLTFPSDDIWRRMGLHHSPGACPVGSQTGDPFPRIRQDEDKLFYFILFIYFFFRINYFKVDQPARKTAWFCLPGLPRISQALTLCG